MALGAACATVPTPSSGTRSAAPAELVVMTYNIHHGARKDDTYDLEAIVSVIKSEGASIVGLQEVDAHWSERSAREDQPERLKELTGMNGCYGPNLVKPSGGRYGTMILSRHPILRCDNQPLPTPAGREQRGVMEAVLDVGGRPLRVINTHLGLSAAERMPQIEAVAALADGQPGARILLGDFNAGPGASAELAPLYRNHVDVWAAVGVGPGFTASSDAPRARIDFIWTSAPFVPLSARVPQTLASDHLPVVAVLRWP